MAILPLKGTVTFNGNPTARIAVLNLEDMTCSNAI